MLAAPIDRHPIVPRKFIRENLSRLNKKKKNEMERRKNRYDINTW